MSVRGLLSTLVLGAVLYPRVKGSYSDETVLHGLTSLSQASTVSITSSTVQLSSHSDDFSSTYIPSPTSISTSTSSYTHETTSSLVHSGSKTDVPSISSASQPAPTTSPVVSDEIDIMSQRRLTFIIEGVNGVSNISSWLSTLSSDGKWPATEVDYTTGCDARRANWPAQTHWNRILTMASAWHGGLKGAEEYVKDPELLDAISRAVDYWFRNDFTNPSCLDSGGLSSCPCGTPGLWNTNWFSNLILIPNLVAQTCLLIRDELTTPQQNNCTYITGRAYGTFDRTINGLGTLTGANLLDVARIGIDQGLLNQNTSLISDAYNRIHNEVVIQNATKADGIRADGSFGQHGGVLYNGNYGKDFANDVLVLEIVAGGTQYAAGQVTKDAFAKLIEGDQWMIYLNSLTGVLHWDFSVLGRFISFPVIDAQATGSIKINVTQIAELGDEWDSSTLKSVATKLSTPTDNANVGALYGNRMFFNNDYMVHRGPGYVTTVKMYSSRTKNTECLNTQNTMGFHLSDGTVYTHLQGNEYEDIAAAWDWNLIPGTTVDYGATPLNCSSTEATGIESFVGGVSDGKIGLAVMQYTNPRSRSLSWQKVWFFLEDDVQHVMVPFVSSLSNASVVSILDQKRRRGNVIVNGQPISQNTNFTSPVTLWHDNVGYVFDQNQSTTTLSVQVGVKTGNWSAIGISTQPPAIVDLFAAWLNHGVRTPVVPVSYSVLPAINQENFFKKASQTMVHNIQNDQDVSAVYDEKHKTVMVVFWRSIGGSVQFSPCETDALITISATGNSAILYRFEKGDVTISDPSQTLSKVQISFSVGAEGRKPPHWNGEMIKQLDVTFPSGGLAGSSVSRQL